MNYIYDILLNFQTKFFDFYDWNDDDYIINPSKIPAYIVKSSILKDLIFNDVIVSNDFITLIKNKAFGYNKKIYGNYICLLCDGRMIVGVCFDKDGRKKYISDLVVDEKYDSLSLIDCFINIDFEYSVLKKNEMCFFDTRLERNIKNILNLKYDELGKDKIDYLLYELSLPVLSNSKNEIIDKLSDYFSNNFYEFLKFSNMFNL